jgi:hypothetical protein
MAVKTKAQIEKELTAATQRADIAEKALKDFKAKVPKVMKEKIEEYSLELCQDGIEDFCETLGVEAPDNIVEASVNIYVTGLNIKAHSSRYGGVDFDETQMSDFEKAVREALDPVLREYGTDRHHVDVTDWDQSY